MKKIKKVMLIIVLVLSVYVSIGAMFPELRSRENIIQIHNMNI